MADMKLALLVLLIMVAVTPITPLCDSSRPSVVSWHNTWHQSFYAYCNSGEMFIYINIYIYIYILLGVKLSAFVTNITVL